MNRTILFKKVMFLLCLISIGAYGQNQSKTYRETFNVVDDAVLEINTSHTDIEFETWDKNEVVIVATIELSDMTDEEADNYFKHGGIEIVGNSKKITIATGAENNWFFRHSIGELSDFHFTMPEVGPIIFEMPEIPEMVEMPPLPAVHFYQFDYKAYKKDGEKYMRQWQKEFSEGFDGEYEQKIEEWGKRMEERAERTQKRREELQQRAEERSERLRERAEERADRRRESTERRMAIAERASANRHRDSTRFLFIQNDSISFGGPNIFYFNSDGREGNIKIKKTIKIKMPKSVKLKMNVRHGEVKLAENTKNMNATLSHASLFAKTIDGDDTVVVASYSPVSVQQWNYGRLQADYSENVNLREVRTLDLKSTSSDITIDLLLDKLSANSSFGPIRINSISKSFKDLNVSLRNAEFVFELPEVACSIYIKGTTSKLTIPVGLRLNVTKDNNNTVHEGFHLKNSKDRSIRVDSKYSEVVIR